MLVHTEPQSVGLAELGQTQAPPVQLCTDGHAWVHVPQLAVSVCVLVQADPQKLGFAVDAQTHVPDGHVWPPTQTLPQVPQLFGSVAGVVHVPLQLV